MASAGYWNTVRSPKVNRDMTGVRGSSTIRAHQAAFAVIDGLGGNGQAAASWYALS